MRLLEFLLVLAVVYLLVGCGTMQRPEWLENGIYRSVSDDDVQVLSRWGVFSIGTSIRAKDRKAIIDALKRSDEAAPAVRSMVSPELGPR